MSQLSDGLQIENMLRQRLSKADENIGDIDGPSIVSFLSLIFSAPWHGAAWQYIQAVSSLRINE